jgi:hypothetical protein
MKSRYTEASHRQPAKAELAGETKVEAATAVAVVACELASRITTDSLHRLETSAGSVGATKLEMLRSWEEATGLVNDILDHAITTLQPQGATMLLVDTLLLKATLLSQIADADANAKAADPEALNDVNVEMSTAAHTAALEEVTVVLGHALRCATALHTAACPPFDTLDLPAGEAAAPVVEEEAGAWFIRARAL